MTDRICAHQGCRKPPVEGSKLCERHLSDGTGTAKKVVAAVGAGVVAAATVAYKIYKAAKS